MDWTDGEWSLDSDFTAEASRGGGVYGCAAETISNLFGETPNGNRRKRNRDADLPCLSQGSSYQSSPLPAIMDLGVSHLKFDDDHDDNDSAVSDEAGWSRSFTSADDNSCSSFTNALASVPLPTSKAVVPALKMMKMLRPLPDQSAFDSTECYTDRSTCSLDASFFSPNCPPTPNAKHGISASCRSNHRNSSLSSNFHGRERRPRSSSDGDVLGGWHPKSRLVGKFSEISEDECSTIPLDTSQVFCRCDSTSCEQPISFREDFALADVVGKGVFAEVFAVVERKSSSMFAIKKLVKPLTSPKDREEKLKEARTMFYLKSFPSPFIIDFVAAWQENEYLYMKMELATNGTLADLLETFKSYGWKGTQAHVPESFVWQVVHNVSSGLLHIHSHGYIHMDIKPGNLLLSAFGHIKIGDFGRAVIAGVGEDGQEGDESYMADELLTSFVRHPSADMFSLGISVLELVCAVSRSVEDRCVLQSPPPMPNFTNKPADGGVMMSPKLTRKHLTTSSLQIPCGGPVWKRLRVDVTEFLPRHASPSLKQLITCCMHSNHLQRCSANDVLHLGEVAIVGMSVDPFLNEASLIAKRLDPAKMTLQSPKLTSSRRSDSFENLESLG